VVAFGGLGAPVDSGWLEIMEVRVRRYMLPIKEPKIGLYHNTAGKMPSVRTAFKESINSMFCERVR
jgi:hypothetical protein